MTRFYGMDVWRGALLSAGIVVHCAALSDLPSFNMIEELSHLFRMEAFFAISGFLAALSLSKYVWTDWLWNRLVMLGVPLALGLLVLVPGNHWLIGYLHQYPGFMHSYFPWSPQDYHMHLWFLVSLVAYAPLTILLVRNRTIVHSLGGTFVMWPRVGTAMLCGLGVVLLVGTRVVFRYIDLKYVDFILQQTIYYSIFYVVGVIAFVHSEFLNRLRDVPVSACILAAAIATLDLYLVARGVGGAAHMIVYFFARPIVGFTATAIIFRSALAIKSCKRWQIDLSQAGYTIYLFHITVILSCLVLIYPAHPSPWTCMLVIPPVVLASLLLFHKYVVKKSSVLEFFLNGRLRRRGKSVS